MGLAPGLRDALREIMGIRKGDVALIVHDVPSEQVSAITREALELDGVVVHEYLLPEGQRPLAETPAPLIALMGRLRPALIFNQLEGRADETPFRVGMISEERMCGAKVGHSPDLTVAMISGPMAADFGEVRRNAARLARRLEGATALRLTSPAGTDLAFSIAGRAFLDDLSIAPGQMGNLPAGETWTAPVERSVNGTLVCDGSIGDLGMVPAPVAVRVADGRAVQVSSGDRAYAGRVAGLLAVDEDAGLAGEFGIGLNPLARLTGLLLEDEKALGTAHIAFGNNLDMPGGRNGSITHRDFLIRSPTIVVQDTGEAVMKDGRLT